MKTMKTMNTQSNSKARQEEMRWYLRDAYRLMHAHVAPEDFAKIMQRRVVQMEVTTDRPGCVARLSLRHAAGVLDVWSKPGLARFTELA
jgi:hypothetical protein